MSKCSIDNVVDHLVGNLTFDYSKPAKGGIIPNLYKNEGGTHRVSFSKNLSQDKKDVVIANYKKLAIKHGNKLGDYLTLETTPDNIIFNINVTDSNVDSIVKSDNLKQSYGNYFNSQERINAGKNLTPASLKKEMLGVKAGGPKSLQKSPFKGSFTDAQGNIYLKIEDSNRARQVVNFVKSKYALSPDTISLKHQKENIGDPNVVATVKIAVHPITKSFPLSPIELSQKALSSVNNDLSQETEVPSDYTGFRYGNYIQKKIEALAKLESYVVTLKNKGDKTKEGRLKIARINKLTVDLKKDIKKYSEKRMYYANYFNTFMKDIESLSHLVKAGDVESLAAVEEYIKILEQVQNEDGGFLSESYDDIRSNPSLSEEEKKIITKLFEDFNTEFGVLNSKYKKAKDGAILQALRDHEKGNDVSEEEIVKMYEEQINGALPDLNLFDLTIDAIDENTSGKNLIGQVAFNIVTKAQKRNNKTSLLQKLATIKDKINAKLIADGHIAESSFLGALRSRASYKIFYRGGEAGTQRLASIFSKTWYNFINYIDGKFSEIDNLVYKVDKSFHDYEKIDTLRTKVFNEIQSKGGFLELRNIPEIVSDPEFKELFDVPDTYIVDASYKQGIIDNIGEIEYNNIVESQKNKLYKFLAYKESITEDYLLRNGVDSIEELEPKEFNTYFASINQHTPLFNTSSNKVLSYRKESDGTIVGIKVVSSLVNSEYLPDFKYKDGVFKDKKFESEIKADPEYHNAWKVMKESLDYINKNNITRERDMRPYTQMTSQVNKTREQIALDKGFVSRLSENTRKFLKNIFSTQNEIDDTKLHLGSAVTTVDKEIKKRKKFIKTTIASKYKIPLKGGDLDLSAVTVTPAMLNTLKTLLKKEDIEGSDLNKIIDEEIQRVVLDSQELDLFKTLESQIDLTSTLKAKKEVEQQILFIIRRLKSQDDGKGSQRKKAIELLELFVNKKIYGINNISNYGHIKQSYNVGEKEIVKEVEVIKENLVKDVKDLESIIEELGPDSFGASEIEEELEGLKKEIEYFDKFIDKNTRTVSVGSVLEAVLFKLSRISAFYLNAKSQIGNYAQGNIAAMEMDGVLWEAGNWYEAKSYLRKWKGATAKLSKKQKENRVILDLLINRFGVFQNSANDIFDVKKSKTASSLVKVLKDGMQLPGEVEKTIQRPQILAILGDRNLVGVRNAKTGEIEPLFDLKDKSNPLKAFEVKEDGTLTLHPDYDTQENRETWLDNTSEEFANYFSDSGVIPNIISTVNGNYKESSVYYAEKNQGTAFFFMFKRWMGQTLKRKFKALYKLKEGNANSLGNTTNYLTAGVYAANIAASLNPLSMLSPLIMATGAYGLSAYKSKQKLEAELQHSVSFGKVILDEFKRAVTNKHFWAGMYRVPTASVAKSIQMVSGLTTGKQIFSNETIANIAGANKNVTDLEIQQDNIQYFNQLVGGLAISLLATSARLLIHAFAYPDDEEDQYDEYGEKLLSGEKRYNKKIEDDESFYSRMTSDSKILMYYEFENLTQKILSDVNLIYGVENMAQSVIPFADNRSIDNLSNFYESFNKQAVEGDYVKGANKGKSRIVVAATRLFVPSALDNAALGFNSSSKKDWSKSDIMDLAFSKKAEQEKIKEIEGEPAFETLNQTRLDNRKKYREDLFEKNKDKYKDKKERNKLINKELDRVYPSFKEDFNEDGTPKNSFVFLKHKKKANHYPDKIPTLYKKDKKKTSSSKVGTFTPAK